VNIPEKRGSSAYGGGLSSLFFLRFYVFEIIKKAGRCAEGAKQKRHRSQRAMTLL
jgi:hypothetical protein